MDYISVSVLLVVLILFGLCGGRYWRVLGSSGGFVLAWVVWVFRGVLCYRGLCFSLSILSAAGLPCSAGVVAYVVYCPGILEAPVGPGRLLVRCHTSIPLCRIVHVGVLAASFS
jgi:hypothetical protein